MSDTNQTIGKYLRSHGFSVTTARQFVFDILAEAVEPVSMATLAQSCRQLDRSSIYRTVSLFEQLGIINRIPAGWKYRLELSDQFKPHHHHAHCLRCGRSIELKADDRLESLLKDMADRNNFMMQSHQIEIHGICNACHQTDMYA